MDFFFSFLCNDGMGIGLELEVENEHFFLKSLVHISISSLFF